MQTTLWVFRYVAPLAAVFVASSLALSQSDLIVNGKVTVAPGSYRNITVLNNGELTFASGTVNASAIYLQYGSIVVKGNLHVAEFIEMSADPSGSLDVLGNSNSAGRIHAHSGTIGLSGSWKFNTLDVDSGGIVKVRPENASEPGSGSLYIECDSLMIRRGGLITGDGAGNDSRGLGCGYSCSGGGGYGGSGGRGYWSATNPGPSFGNEYDSTIDMGGAGSVYGGGGISITGRTKVTIEGKISSSGTTNGSGNGSGGGIMIVTPLLILKGSIQAQGGNAPYTTSGGGGGGRVKLFYSGGVVGTSIRDSIFVSGGSRGGYLNTADGGIGTIFTNSIPKAPRVLFPVNKDTLNQSNPTMRLFMVDSSRQLDGRIEDLTCRIEFSRDSFVTVCAVFDQLAAMSGWSRPSYRSDSTAIFTVRSLVPKGLYQWRASVRDRSLYGPSSDIQNVFVDEITSSEERESTLPARFTLEQNYPNPFNPSTLIQFGLPSRALVSLVVFNPLGQIVRELANAEFDAGMHEIRFDGSGLSSGVYFYQMRAAGFIQTKRLVLLR
jgi:hypothetical protein